MDADEVELALADAELVTCLQAPLVEAKQLRDECLAAEIPVLLIAAPAAAPAVAAARPSWSSARGRKICRG